MLLFFILIINIIYMKKFLQKMSDINTNDWELKDVIIFKLINGVLKKQKANTF